MNKLEELQALRAEVKRLIGNITEATDILKDMEGNKDTSAKAILYISRRLSEPLIEEGLLLPKHLVRSFLLLNFDEIHNCIKQVSSNTALSMELIKDRIDTVEITALFNMQQYTEDVEILMEDIKAKNIPPAQLFTELNITGNFLKFFHSFICHAYPELFGMVLITAVMEKRDIRNLLKERIL